MGPGNSQINKNSINGRGHSSLNVKNKQFKDNICSINILYVIKLDVNFYQIAIKVVTIFNIINKVFYNTSWPKKKTIQMLNLET